MHGEGFRSEGIPNARDDFGDKIGRGCMCIPLRFQMRGEKRWKKQRN